MGNTSIADLPEDIQRQVRQKWDAEDLARGLYAPDAVKKPSKYKNQRTPYKSIQGFERVYDSKAEAKHAEFLDNGVRLKLIKWWLPQVPIPLPGGVKYIADFLVCWDNKLAFADVKGRDTQASRNKRKQVFALYGIDVEIVRK